MSTTNLLLFFVGLMVFAIPCIAHIDSLNAPDAPAIQYNEKEGPPIATAPEHRGKNFPPPSAAPPRRKLASGHNGKKPPPVAVLPPPPQIQTPAT
ncbi:hypothetical protein ABFS82_07G074800 [Erythranthe guttata]|uniref:Uncharacterized protein n=1 Tax=Erythranthe guttata TaxID=4155 RepID=A0A022RJB7_ERYGU|nr:hypothetical protein MIMGU_mgv1a017084mg [Erythranthe guttata]